MTTIYYFSATGNSLTTARYLAEQLGDCRLVPVASTKALSKVKEESHCVGFVFPVYYGNMPYPVRGLISKMVFQPDSRVFLCASYRGHAGKVAQRMDTLLRSRGQKLSLALGVALPGNSFINAAELDKELLEQQYRHLDEQLSLLRQGKSENYYSEEILPLTPVDYPNNFRGITVDENCVGCGRCVEVCPMDNITLRDGKAVIGDDCATCLACFHWCPMEAIWMSKAEPMWERMKQDISRRSKYHHPEVNIVDIAQQKV